MRAEGECAAHVSGDLIDGTVVGRPLAAEGPDRVLDVCSHDERQPDGARPARSAATVGVAQSFNHARRTLVRARENSNDTR